MNSKDLIFDLLAQHRKIYIPNVFIKLTGDINAAAVLAQCIYYSDTASDSEGYFHKTYKEWQDELNLSKYQVNKIIKQFREMDIVNTKIKKVDGVPMLHYKVNSFVLTEKTNGMLEG